MTLEQSLADIVEKSVARALAQIFPNGLPAELMPAAPAPVVEDKPKAKAKKPAEAPAPAPVSETPAPEAEVVTTAALPAPAPAPTVAATAAPTTAESALEDQAKVREMISIVKGGSVTVREFIAKHGGTKFVDMPADKRALVIADVKERIASEAAK